MSVWYEMQSVLLQVLAGLGCVIEENGNWRLVDVGLLLHALRPKGSKTVFSRCLPGRSLQQGLFVGMAESLRKDPCQIYRSS